MENFTNSTWRHGIEDLPARLSPPQRRQRPCFPGRDRLSPAWRARRQYADTVPSPTSNGAVGQASRRTRVPAMMDWREHYRRMKRTRARLNAEWNTQAKRPDWIESVRDAFYDFFQTCYHLVDWLDNDPSQPIRRQEANEFVRASAALSLCRDLCLGRSTRDWSRRESTHCGRSRRLSASCPSWTLGEQSLQRCGSLPRK